MEQTVLRMDLNLLKALHVLLEERNVAHAADRLFVTPSAMSKTLHRLREALDDPLLVRTAHGLMPTPRAEALAVVLKDAFVRLENLEPTKFDPAKAAGRIRCAAPETFALGVIPELMQALRLAAPRLHIESTHMSESYLEQLARGELDFVVYLDQAYPDDYVTHSLFAAVPKVWCRHDHPITRLKTLTLENLYKYPVVAFRSLNIKAIEMQTIAKVVEQAGLVRDVILETSQLLLAMTAIRRTDALMVAPDYLFRYQTESDKLAALSVEHIPLFNRLSMNICLIQHERTVNSPLHRWVASEAMAAVQPGAHQLPAAVRV